MPSKSAGILAFRIREGRIEVLLVHPGGPFWRNRDLGAWTIPKGELDASEDPEQAARREFREELGIALSAPLLPLGEIRQRGGKIVEAFATEHDIDVAAVQSNSFEIEWPPHSGKRQRFPEIDRAEWMILPEARERILPSQLPILDAIEEQLKGGSAPRSP